jgi:AraC family transcriptional regulator of adaptative response/methylated-DNA-[protein]-cysteine methyltransferase
MVHFVIQPSPPDSLLGPLLVAGTDQGVCALYLGEDEEYLKAELAREIGAASDEAHEPLRRWAATIAESLVPGAAPANVPLDVRGTAFQRRVWDALRTIPPGTTRTYREVAESLGMPTAARAVARGCATNAVSLLIPCHRVIRGDGGLGGYRWGLGRKQRLLELERAQAARELF